MAKYIYKALKDNKIVVNGEIEATTPRSARDKIRELGYLPLNIYNPDGVINESVTKAEAANVSKIRSMGLTDKIFFTSELQVLLSAGIPIVEALNTVEENSHKVRIKKMAGELKNAISTGLTFSQALNSLYHDVFGDTFIDLCATGELSGELDITLERVLTMLKKQDSIKGRIIQASIYPIILILLMFGILILFSKLVFPIFGAIMTTNGVDAPLFAKTVWGFCTFVGDYWLLCLVAIFAFIGAINFLATNRDTRAFFDKLLLKIPLINEFVSYVNLSNYMCVLQISYDSGVPIIKSFELATKTIGNTEMKKQAIMTKKIAAEGAILSEAFKRSRLLPGAFVTMMASGEKAGNLGKMMKDIVNVIDKKVDLVLESLAKAFEPFMIIVMGIFTLVIAVAFFQMYMGMSTSF